MSESRNKTVSDILNILTMILGFACVIIFLIDLFDNQYSPDSILLIIFFNIPVAIFYCSLYFVLLFISSKLNGTTNGFRFKKTSFIIPILVCIFSFICHSMKELYVKKSKEEPNRFSTILIESQSGCIHNSYNIDFKMNYKVLFSESHKFSDEFYWGDYTLNGDTVVIDIKKSVLQHNIGIIKNDTLTFIGDTLIYLVRKE